MRERGDRGKERGREMGGTEGETEGVRGRERETNVGEIRNKGRSRDGWKRIEMGPPL